MKALIHTIVFVLFSSALQGPDIAGTWSGTLEVQGTKLRVVFHVKESDKGYKATMDSPDQNASGIAVSGVNYDYPNIRFDVASAEAYYEGVVHTEKEITGKWVQAGTAFYLVLEK